MTDAAVELLVKTGVIREIAADEAATKTELAAARKHVESAAEIAETDPNGAFQLAYDAARKAAGAHMRARGYRVGSRQAAHVNTGRYLAAALDQPSLAVHIDAFDDMRSLRDQSEYDALLLDEADARDAIEHADAIVSAVENDLT